MKQNLNEEIQRILYLSGHKRGVVISEQNIFQRIFGKKNDGNLRTDKRKNPSSNMTIPDANGQSSGITKFDVAQTPGTGVGIARNVYFKDDLYILGIFRKVGKSLAYFKPATPGTPDTPGDQGKTTGDTPTIPTLEFSNKQLPYPDNFVKPRWELYPDANTAFKNWCDNLGDAIMAAGGEKDGKILFFENRDENGKPIEVYGSANNVRPTWDIPRSMRRSGVKKLDHDYGGKTIGDESDPAGMNLYLAEQRAKNFGQSIANSLYLRTRIPVEKFLQYMSFSHKSYYGGSEKGVKQVKVSVKGLIPGKTIPDSSSYEVAGTKGTEGTSGEIVQPQETDVVLNFGAWGYPNLKIIARTTINEGGEQFITISKAEYDDLKSKKIAVDYQGDGNFNGKNEAEFVIDDEGGVTLDGIYFGIFRTSSSNYYFSDSPVTQDPFSRYASYPGLYTGILRNDRVIVYNIYLTLNKIKGRE